MCPVTTKIDKEYDKKMFKEIKKGWPRAAAMADILANSTEAEDETPFPFDTADDTCYLIIIKRAIRMPEHIWQHSLGLYLEVVISLLIKGKGDMNIYI
jgi:hypothetical protein